MWLTIEQQQSIIRFAPELEPWLPERGAYLENITNRMRASGEGKLAEYLERIAL